MAQEVRDRLIHYTAGVLSLAVYILILIDIVVPGAEVHLLSLLVLVLLMGVFVALDIYEYHLSDNFENEMVSDPVERVKRKYNHRDMTEAEFEAELEDVLEQTGAWRPDDER